MEREIRLLEFDKIRALLSAQTVTAMGKELAEDLLPTDDPLLAERWQKETTEAVSLLTRRQLELEVIGDLRRLLEYAARGSMLGEEQLQSVVSLLNAVAKLKLYFKETADFPILAGLAERMDALPLLREELKRSLNEDGRLRDDASPELLRLRRAITAGERDLRERFDKFIKNPMQQKYLQENLITVRGDRLVIPVRLEYRAQVPGIVHDQSSSGATLFIEPMWAVEANNKLTVNRRLQERERESILVRLSQWIGAEQTALQLSLNFYGECDFIRAKGRLSLAQKAVEPSLNSRGFIKLNAGRHPLLTGEVVPISLEMGECLRTLVITGPNTGGKTVTLKTVGLLTLMAQSGLHVPAGAGTELAVFPWVFADIGDEQDISQSLSTFSGHLKNIIEIIGNLAPGSLVLLDEVGAGTDPTEGAGLAMAILEYLHSAGAVTVATTHYSRLKAFAYLTEGMDNASVAFDVATLRPTYQLMVGIPGVSNAFNIARRLGLPEEIISRGYDFLSNEEVRFEETVADLVADRRRMELASNQAQDDKKRAELLFLQAKAEKEELVRKKADILESARREAQETVIRAKREAQQLLKDLRRKVEADRQILTAEIDDAAERLQGLEGFIADLALPVSPEKRLAAAEVMIGMGVYVHSLGQQGTVVHKTGRQVQVQMGAIRVQVEVSDLSLRQPAKKLDNRQTLSPLPMGRSSLSRELDLRGLTLDEAEIKVDDYLAEATVAGLQEVRLIHGKGTGRLRAGLKQYLQGHDCVESMRIGQPSEGGTGATVVKLRAELRS
ncbi:MAG: endonuclease MutS2 [Dethiobacter sp.]|nr:endonuclease MutS2 [Dethiobacter sp.]MBS3988341.1 endonuclease MutS2 [Dethiobacter sp.]